MKVQVLYTKTFLKSAKRLPKSQQAKLAILIEVLQKQPFAPTLHTKPLTGRLAGFYSFRITRDWRVIFQFIDSRTIKLIDVGHRRKIYQ